MNGRHLSWVELKRVDPWSFGRAMAIVGAMGGAIAWAPHGEYHLIISVPLCGGIGLLLGGLGGWLYNTMALRWGGVHLTLAIAQFEAGEEAAPDAADGYEAAPEASPLPPRPHAPAPWTVILRDWPFGWTSIASACLAAFLPILGYALPMAYSMDREMRRLAAFCTKAGPAFWLAAVVLGIVAIVRGDRGRGIAGLVICAIEVGAILAGLGWVAMQFASGEWGFG